MHMPGNTSYENQRIVTFAATCSSNASYSPATIDYDCVVDTLVV
jgi:hypothetical protein